MHGSPFIAAAHILDEPASLYTFRELKNILEKTSISPYLFSAQHNVFLEF
jgi:hypothetical protein